MAGLGDKEILMVVDAVSHERNLPVDKIFEAIESALAAVAERESGDEHAIRVSIDRESGASRAFRYWTVVENDMLEDEDREIRLDDARKDNPQAEVGHVIEVEIEGPVNFHRIGAAQAKQIIVQKVREAEREKIAESYERRIGELVTGSVKKVNRDQIVLDLGENAEGVLPREQMIPREKFNMNDRVRAYLYEVSHEKRGPQIMVSRAHPDFLKALFAIEVPEVGEEVIEIRACARDPGSRAKIAVKTNDGRIDPVGACVGIRGSRVQAVSGELNGERIDIILWDDNPAQLVINAMSPAEVASIVVDEDSRTMDIAVAEDQLSQAIGRGGQNIRLASELCGWKLNVMSEAEGAEKAALESTQLQNIFMKSLDIEADLAAVLVREGFTKIDDLAYVDVSEFAGMAGLDEEIGEELQNRAKDVLLTLELEGKAKPTLALPAKDLLALDGMTQELALALASRGIVTREDLAEQAVDDLEDVEELDEAKAAELIMAARQHWFN